MWLQVPGSRHDVAMFSNPRVQPPARGAAPDHRDTQARVPAAVGQAIDRWQHAGGLAGRVRFTQVKKAIQGVPVRNGTPPRPNEAYAAALERLMQAPANKATFGRNEQRRLLETAIRYSLVDKAGVDAPHTQALSVPGHLGALSADLPLPGVMVPEDKQRMLEALLGLRLEDPQAKALLAELMAINVRHGGLPRDVAGQRVLMQAFFAHHRDAGEAEFRQLAIPVLEAWLNAYPHKSLAATFVDEMTRQGRALALMNDTALRSRMFERAGNKPQPTLPAAGGASTQTLGVGSRTHALYASRFARAEASVEEWLARLEGRLSTIGGPVYTQDFADAKENVELVRAMVAALNIRDPSLNLAYSASMAAFRRELTELARDGSRAGDRLHRVLRLAPDAHSEENNHVAVCVRKVGAELRLLVVSPAPWLKQLRKQAAQRLSFDDLGLNAAVKTHVVFTDAQHGYLDCLNCSTYFCEQMNAARPVVDGLVESMSGQGSDPTFSPNAFALPAAFMRHAHALRTIDAWEAGTGDTEGGAWLRAQWQRNAVDLQTDGGMIRTSAGIDAYHHELLEAAVSDFRHAIADDEAARRLLAQVAKAARLS